MRTARLSTISRSIPGPFIWGGGEYPSPAPPRGQNDWQTPVKTFPSRNFVDGR